MKIKTNKNRIDLRFSRSNSKRTRSRYIPKNKELRVEMIWLYHDVLALGHRK